MHTAVHGITLANFDNVCVIAAIWVGLACLACLASLVSMRVGLSVALVAAGLTFDSISALFGLTHGYIDQAQYSVLVTVVVLTALVPTTIAQTVFRPHTHALRYGSESPMELVGVYPELAEEEA